MADDVRSRFKEYLKARLTSDRARAEWRAELENGWAMLLATKVTALVEPASLLCAIENATRREAFEKVVAPVFVAGRKDIFPIVKSNDDTLSAYVPKEARDAIDELLGKPGLMHDKLVEEIMKQEVVEEIMRDVLSDALEEFNDKVNPFFADWGLPGLIKKFVPIGGGAVLRSIESVRGEYDKRLKPEIQKFLQGFSRRALDKTAKVIVARADDPKSVALRRAIAKWLWEQKVKDLVANVDDEKWALGEKAGLLIAQQAAQTKRVQDARNELVYAFFKRHEQHTVKEALAEYGVDPQLDFDLLAEATWPAVKSIATSDVATNYVATIVAEFIASEAREG
jgi:hypothetical protein